MECHSSVLLNTVRS